MIPSSVTQFRTVPQILFGFDALSHCGTYLSEKGFRRPLFVIDKMIYELGVVNHVLDIMKDEGREVVVYADIASEPCIEHVEAGTELYRENRCDCVVAVGGGSSIDGAKGMAAMATNPGSIREYQGWDKITHPRAPLIAVPTTAGTGSEVTQTAVISDEQNKLKMRILSPLNIPDLAIEDPQLTLSMPPSVTAGTGMDALTHAIEAFISRRRQPLTSAMALSAIGHIAPNLVRAWAKGDDREARESMMVGQLLAAQAFTNASTALVHGMARTVGIYFHIPHGMANAILLPHVMEFTLPAVPYLYAAIAEAMGERIEGLTPREKAERAVVAVKGLCRDMGIPTLSDMGVTEDSLPELSEHVFAVKPGTPDFNPRLATVENVREIYYRALYRTSE